MITHIVIFWLAEEDGPQARELLRAAASLGDIPGVLNLRAGPPLPSPRDVVDDSFAVALAMDFASEDALAEYQDHPIHQTFVRDHVRDRVQRFVVYDIQA